MSEPNPNLILNSAQLDKWSKESGIVVEWDGEEQMFKVSTPTRASSRWGAYQDVAVEPSTQYTYSLDGMAGNVSCHLAIADGTSWSATRATFTQTRDRLSYTWTTGASATVARVYLCITPTQEGLDAGGSYGYFAMPKLELGSEATEWCAHPSEGGWRRMSRYIDSGGLSHLMSKIKAAIAATVTGVKGNAESSYRTGQVNITPANVGAVAKSGDTMTGLLTLNSNQYEDSYTSGALNLNNSNIYGVNSIYTADKSDDSKEGIHFYRDATHVDTLWAKDGLLYFAPNRQLTTTGTSYTVLNTSSNLSEANLVWGGKNFSGSYGLIDAAMVSDLGANRTACISGDAVTVEYSRDKGVTWTDYGATKAQKGALFAQGNGFVIGKADSTNKATANEDKYQLRVTIDTGVAHVYTTLNKFVFYISTTGSLDCTVKIQKALQSTPDNFVDHTSDVPISGWSGWNVVNTNGLTTYGNTPASQYGRVRFVFKANGGNTTYNGLSVSRIMSFGGVGWTTPSNLAKTGHVYTYDQDQNATFPAKVTATNGFSGNLTGNVSGTAANVTGVVAAANGGTGQTSLTNSANALINSLSTGSSAPTDADYYVSQYAGGGTTTTTYHRRPMSALWAYIKGKIESLVLSTSTSSISTTTAATSSAVKTAYDLANTANGTANTALSGVNGTLIYDHTYTIANGVATFTAHVYCKGEEVTSQYADSAFSWSYRLSDAISETGTPSVVSLGTGKTKTINITTLGLGGHVIGTFTTD